MDPVGGQVVGNYCSCLVDAQEVPVVDKIRNGQRKRYCYCLNRSLASLATPARPAGAVEAAPLFSFSFALPPVTLLKSAIRIEMHTTQAGFSKFVIRG